MGLFGDKEQTIVDPSTGIETQPTSATDGGSTTSAVGSPSFIFKNNAGTAWQSPKLTSEGYIVIDHLDNATAPTNISALNASVAVTTDGTGTAIFLVSGTWVGTLSLQATIDGTNWASLDAISDTSELRVTSITANARLVVSSAGYTQVRLTFSAYTSGTATIAANASIASGPTQVFNTQTQPLYSQMTDSLKSTYSAAIIGLVTPTLATDIFTLTGSATKTIRITHVEISGTTTAGSGASVNVSLLKRSTANSAGTSTAPTLVPYDSSNAAATATALAYTANPTLGTSVGVIRATRLELPAVGGVASPVVFDFGNRPAQAIVLRGTSQVFSINFNSTSITGPVIDISIEFTEE